jgi:hypothetical protein
VVPDIGGFAEVPGFEGVQVTGEVLGVDVAERVKPGSFGPSRSIERELSCCLHFYLPFTRLFVFVISTTFLTEYSKCVNNFVNYFFAAVEGSHPTHRTREKVRVSASVRDAAFVESDIMGTVYILGAGFSKAVSNEMPTLMDLPQALRSYSARKARGDDTVAELDQLGSIGNVEMILTYLVQAKPWLSESANLRARALFLDVTRLIADLIHDRMCACFQKLNEAPWLNLLMKSWHRNRDTVITFNYDMIVETAAGKVVDPIDLPGIYGVPLTPASLRARGAGTGLIPSKSFTLLKLHGSTGWFYSGSSEFSGETIFAVFPNGPTYWDDSESPEARCSSKAREDEFAAVRDKFPLIVPPVFEKGVISGHETLRHCGKSHMNVCGRRSGSFLLDILYPNPICRSVFY